MAKDKYIKIYKAKAHRFIETKDLPRFVKLGWSKNQNASVEQSDELKAAYARIAVLEGKSKAEKAALDKPIDKMNKAELLAKAELENVTVDENATNKELVFAIKTALGLLDDDGNDIDTKKDMDV